MRARILHRGLGPRITLKLVMGAFAVLGLGMLLGTIILFHSTAAFLAGARSAPGVVTELEYRRDSDGGTYYPLVRFRGPDGRDLVFRGQVGSSPPAYARGEAVTVLYDPATPENARIDGFFQLWFGPLILGGLGLVFGGIGLGYWTWRLLTARRDAWLERHGARITARIVDVGLDGSLAMNGQSPWRIRAQWQDPLGDEVFVFNSRAIWFDPAPFLTGEEIGVLIDRRNPGRYRLDLSFLPES